MLTSTKQKRIPRTSLSAFMGDSLQIHAASWGEKISFESELWKSVLDYFISETWRLSGKGPAPYADIKDSF